MYTNTPATLYNALHQGNTTVYRRTVLSAVFWQDDKQASIAKAGLTGADRARVFVPFSVEAQGKSYLAPALWWQSPDGRFTFQPKDYLVKGICPYEYAAGKHPLTELLALDNVLTLTQVDTRDFGSAEMRHWELGGK